MEMLDILSNQYRASLKMLEHVITACPEALWVDAADKNPFWNVAYHALFYTHLYLQQDEPSFRPWANHHRSYQDMPQKGEPYTREQVLEYLQVCLAEIANQLPYLDLDSPSGFPWLQMSKCEVQIYNIRHIMQHTGELSDRLGNRCGMDVPWVSSVR
jgi:hypothetical protein